MEAARELLDLVLRWLHVIAAIMWIGNSLLFNWLDNRLRPVPAPREGSRGGAWLLHSGGFYEVEKTVSPGSPLPEPLHWFKWQAYTTWLSGAALLVVVYYLNAGALLVGAGAALSPAAATALGVAVLAGGLLVYELVWRSPLARRPAFSAMLCFALLLGLAYGLGRVYTGRAAFLHVGALLGTLMAANVALKIMPAQRALVGAVARGEEPDPRLGEQAKLRSIHNNYMTFPVIVLMLSSHFPSFHGRPDAWLVLAVLVLAGAGIRHVLNERFHFPHWKPALGATIAAAVAALYLLSARPAAAPPPVHAGAGVPVSFEAAAAVVHKRCTVCHSASPADRSFGAAPAGVVFDTPEQIRAHAARIEARAVVGRTMPPANKTWMTEEERALLRAWLQAR